MSSGLRARSVITPLHGRLRRQVWLATIILIGVVNTAALAVAVAMNASFVETFGQVSTATAEAAGAIACAIVARKLSGHPRIAWACFAAALAIWSLTDWAYLVAMLAHVDVPEVSAFDIGWLLFYAAVLRNFLEGYRIAARALRTLSAGPASQRELVLRALRIGEQMFLGGEIERAEAVSRPVVENAVLAFREMGYLERDGDTLSLAPGFRSDEAAAAIEARIGDYLTRPAFDTGF